jgi:hypothetical protein
MVQVRVANNDRMNFSLASLSKVRTASKEVVQIPRQALAVSIVTRTFTTRIYQHRVMLKFQKDRFSLAHVDEVNLVPGNGLGIALNA